LLLWLLHSMLAILHTLFEFTEHALDILIEQLFHTDPRTTEIIVFYLMVGIVGSIIFSLLKALPRWYSQFFEMLDNIWNQEKVKAITYWQHQSAIEKVKSGTILMASLIIAVLWVFN
jgi:hypothetical protein